MKLIDVKCTIDRPIHSHHPKYPDMVYEVNYGYVDNIIAKDNEFQDVYILGEDQPLCKFEGQVIAIIHRKNDIEDKWVVTNNKLFSLNQIKEATHFCEKYFDSSIELLYQFDVINIDGEINQFIDLITKVFKDNCHFTEIGQNSFFKLVNFEMINDLTKKTNYRLYGIKVNDKLVSCMALKDFHHVSLLFTDDLYQNMSMGKTLIDFAIDIAKKHEFSEVNVNASYNALDFYLHMAFEKLSDLIEENGIKYYKMKRRI